MNTVLTLWEDILHPVESISELVEHVLQLLDSAVEPDDPPLPHLVLVQGLLRQLQLHRVEQLSSPTSEAVLEKGVLSNSQAKWKLEIDFVFPLSQQEQEQQQEQR